MIHSWLQHTVIESGTLYARATKASRQDKNYFVSSSFLTCLELKTPEGIVRYLLENRMRQDSNDAYSDPIGHRPGLTD